MTKIDALRNYLNDFVELVNEEYWMSIDWLDNDKINFSISPLPLENNGLISRDVLGNRTYNYSVMHSVVFDYSPDILAMIENSEYFELLENWIDERNKAKEYPEIEGAYEVRITQSPFLFQSMPDIKIATVYRMAIDNGWQPPRDPNYKPTPQAKPQQSQPQQQKSIDVFTPLIDITPKGKPLSTIENMQEILNRIGVIAR